MTNSLRWGLVLGLGAAGCQCDSPRTAAATAPPDAAIAAAAPDSGIPAGPTLTLGLLRYDAALPPAEKMELPKTAAFLPIEVKAVPATGTARQAPGWKYIQQMMVSKGTAKLVEAHGVGVDGNQAFEEFFQLYEKNRYRPLLIDSKEVDEPDPTIYRTFLTSLPSVVTSDLVLHNLHLFFDFSLARAEEERFLPELLALVSSVSAEARGQATALAGTKWADAANDNLVFLGVARALLRSAALARPSADESQNGMGGVDTGAEIERLGQLTVDHADELVDSDLPVEVRTRVKQELGRVAQPAGLAKPSLFDYPDPFQEDYSQYVVRGHYVKTPALQAYFRATMWLSRILMSFRSERATRSAVLLSLAMTKADHLARWHRLFDAMTFLVGPPDDVTFEQLLQPMAAAAAKGMNLDDPATFDALRAKWTALTAPEIQAVVTQQEHGPDLATTAGLHFFSQRTVIDAAILQGLVDPKVPNRNTVLALEVPAVLGSPLAQKLVAAQKPSAAPEYATQRALLEEQMPKRLDGQKTAQFYAGWLDAMGPLLEPVPADFPAFMRDDAFPVLRLETWLASYAQLKHDTVLYSKQAMAEMGGPGFEDKEIALDDRGYVIPEVELYARTGALLARLRTGLTARKLFPSSVAESYGRFETLVSRLESISRKELSGTALSEEDYHLIKFIGGDLEHFWEATLTAKNHLDRWQLLDQNNSAVVADIFTGPHGIKHVASGLVHPVYVAFPRDGKVAVGRGGVMAFYELDLKERLTDAKWLEMLKTAHPPHPEWTRAVLSIEPKKAVSFFSDLEGD